MRIQQLLSVSDSTSLSARFFRITSTVLVALSLFTAFPLPIQADDPIWPIDYYPYISSSFGEPRPGRFHYGIDPKSGGVTGKKVFAIGDGYISHVKTSTGGYGKGLYLSLDTGETVVYGHLSEYLPEIEDRLVMIREQNNTYDVEAWFTSKEFRVTAGQLIGWSGDTGSWGAPHLHLEIRDSDNNPINPMDKGYTIKDTIPPQIRSAVLIPLDSTSSVNGQVQSHWWSDKDSDPIWISGRIGVATSVWDKADGVNNQMGVYDISLAVDGEVIFSKRYDTLSYSFNGSGSLDYLDGGFYGGSGTISALFRHPGNLLPFYTGNGVIIVPQPAHSSEHTLTITASDYDGNTSIVEFPVVFGSRPLFRYCGADGSGMMRIAGNYDAGDISYAEIWSPGTDGSWMLNDTVLFDDGRRDIAVPVPEGITDCRVVLVAEDSTRSLPAALTFNGDDALSDTDADLTVDSYLRHDRLMVSVSSNLPLSSVPVIEVTENGELMYAMRCTTPSGPTTWTDAIPLVMTGHKNMVITVHAFDAAGAVVSSITPVDCTVLDSMKDCVITSSDSLMSVTVPAGSLYRNVIAQIRPEPVTDTGELRARSNGYRFVIGEERLREPVTAQIRFSEPLGPHTGMFYKNGENGTADWKFVSNELSGQVFSGSLSSAVAVALFEDTTPPVVLPVAPGNGAVLSNRRPEIRVTVRDGGAGLEGSDSIRMTLDGRPVYGEYNPLRELVLWSPRIDLAVGEHTVDVTVTDQTGNSAARSWAFTVR